ncbi:MULTISPECIES: hypothetical protein [unclassified Streptomyces]|uniref:hypothetical protein n=1 Tax=unclassified Streptomyces TaxID=2593676 RepID=UPI00278C3369|nr:MULTISPECIES: hypothetical protein [unclassified Streptomyces]
MNLVLRAGRAYWRLNERAWATVRRATVPLLAATGAASMVCWVLGVRSGDPLMLWAPALFGSVMLVGATAARR